LKIAELRLKAAHAQMKAARAQMWMHLIAGFVIDVSVMQIFNLTIQALGH